MSRLDTATNIGLLVACVLLSAVAGQRLWVLAFPPQPPQGYSRGDSAPRVKSVDYSAARQTVLLFISTKCKYCADSMPFYAELSNQRRKVAVQLVVVGFEPEPALQEFLRTHNVTVDRVATIDVRHTKLFATPTLVLADRTGTVVSQWIGALGQQASAVRSAIGIPEEPAITPRVEEAAKSGTVSMRPPALGRGAGSVEEATRP